MSRKLLAGTLVLSAAIAAAAFCLKPRDPVYSRSVSTFLAHPLYDRPVRVQGRLLRGSLCRRDDPCEYRFQLVDRDSIGVNASGLFVRYLHCFIPDGFRDVPGLDVTVTVEGELCSGCHHLQASQVYTTGPRKYELKVRDSHSEPVSEPLPRLKVCPEL